MSSDYEKGYHGWAGGGGWEYEQGRRDAEAGMPPRQQPGPNEGPDMSGVSDAGFRYGVLWRKDPDKALKESLRHLLLFTVLGGVVGFAMGTWLGNPELWFIYAKAFFWFDAVIILSFMLGAMLGGVPTRRGMLTLLFLGGIVGYMTWTYVLYPVVFIHIK